MPAIYQQGLRLTWPLWSSLVPPAWRKGGFRSLSSLWWAASACRWPCGHLGLPRTGGGVCPNPEQDQQAHLAADLTTHTSTACQWESCHVYLPLLDSWLLSVWTNSGGVTGASFTGCLKPLYWSSRNIWIICKTGSHRWDSWPCAALPSGLSSVLAVLAGVGEGSLRQVSCMSRSPHPKAWGCLYKVWPGKGVLINLWSTSGSPER